MVGGVGGGGVKAVDPMHVSSCEYAVCLALTLAAAMLFAQSRMLIDALVPRHVCGSVAVAPHPVVDGKLQTESCLAHAHTRNGFPWPPHVNCARPLQ